MVVLRFFHGRSFEKYSSKSCLETKNYGHLRLITVVWVIIMVVRKEITGVLPFREIQVACKSSRFSPEALIFAEAAAHSVSADTFCSYRATLKLCRH